MTPPEPPALSPGSRPMTEAEHLDWLRLARSHRVGPATFRRLLQAHGSAGAALEALPAIAAEAGVRAYAPCPPAVAEEEYAAGRRAGARLICLGEPGYPQLLAGIADAPPCLWLRGSAALADRGGVALVGARNASALGLRMAEALSRGLAEAGQVVISGLARGIDTAAHRASLAGGTVAVLAGGVDVIYPRENAALAAEILDGGTLLSEMPMGLVAQARHFPRRNRIVSGLADAIVVVEGAARSGSLITARNALDQGREVMAVPGHPFDARAAGCNLLIRDGATLVRSAADIVEALTGDRPAREVPRPSPGRSAATERPAAPAPPRGTPHDVLLSLLGPSPVSEDMLIRRAGLPSADVLEALTELDLRGRISRHPGGMVSLCVA